MYGCPLKEVLYEPKYVADKIEDQLPLTPIDSVNMDEPRRFATTASATLCLYSGRHNEAFKMAAMSLRSGYAIFTNGER